MVARSEAIKNWAPPEKTMIETIKVVQTLKPDAFSKIPHASPIGM
ncbi:hypothetical protein LOT_0987 [Lentilactobacillus otakiensis DSM 19908 = JCM 15040]|uniref:Uncharacterized protein n=1 Tax=Lentilactobacillus otakiensis DSM 19908 = JCM 15040 TaxID=1423780 RepID=S4NCB9_9LACO|nr:hypothetical protein LOT_0987 [Lentilactobacillus otakiensis DSM 19908 = JCM 15040]